MQKALRKVDCLRGEQMIETMSSETQKWAWSLNLDIVEDDKEENQERKQGLCGVLLGKRMDGKKGNLL
jgi:hypothetical protein